MVRGDDAIVTWLNETNTGGLLVEQGKNDQLLVLAFNSDFVSPKSAHRPFEFFELTSILGCSRIHCVDRKFLFYHEGIDELCGDIHSVAGVLRDHIAALAPKVTVALGASSGAYAATVFGHRLGLDHVHALGPVTCLYPEYMEQHAREDTEERWIRYRKLWESPRADWDLFDLAKVLRLHNGRTRYYQHYCSGCARDRYAAERLKGLPGVHLSPYDCDHHYVVFHLVKEKLLQRLFFPRGASSASVE